MSEQISTAEAWDAGYDKGLSDGQRHDGYATTNPYGRPDTLAPSDAASEREAVIGNLAVLRDEFPDDDPAHETLDDAIATIERLAASRQGAVSVSREQVDAAMRWLRDSWGRSPSGRANLIATNARAITRNLLAELGIEVTD